MEIFSLITGILSIASFLVVAYLSYDIYRYERLSKGWLAVTAAFFIIILRRIIGFVTEAGVDSQLRVSLKNTESVLLLIISAFFIVGFWAMKKNFERFEVIEKRVKNKLKSFSQ